MKTSREDSPAFDVNPQYTVKDSGSANKPGNRSRQETEREDAKGSDLIRGQT
jgi:hypothetical protein